MVLKFYVEKLLLIYLTLISSRLIDAQEFCYECDPIDGVSDCFNNYQQNICKNEAEDSDYLGCYHFENNGLIKRGCVSNLTQVQLDDCIKGIVCKICREDYCNSKRTFQKCFTCNSADDTNCATLQSSLDDKTCDDYMDLCKVYVKPNMTTNRGCLSELSQDIIDCHPQAVNCRQCSENNCNGEIFPPNRLTCFHGKTKCDDEDENCFLQQNENLNQNFPCEIYNFRDSCFLYLDENKTATRGCLSDSFFNEFCTKNPQKCRTCQTSNCNYESVIKPPKLSCVICDTSEECAWSYDASLATPCESDVYFHEEETCFTYIVSEEKTIRGCTLDSNLCKINNCTYCNEDGCNSQGHSIQSCYVCSSLIDKKCSEDLLNVEKSSCGDVSYEERGCYTIKDINGSIERGCVADLSTEKKEECQQDSNCLICINNNCNNKLFNHAVHTKISLSILILIILINLFNKSF